jgi:hypothetical protein
MGIRENINKFQKTALVASSVLTVGAVVFAVTSQRESLTVKPPKLAYYSDDDGQTFFVDAYGKMGPFDHDGKTAVVARVFKSEDGKLFIGYLERAADAESKRLLEDAQQTLIATAATQPVNPDPVLIEEMMKRTLVKRAGDAKWVNATSEEAVSVTRVQSPGGGDATLVMP